MKKKIITAILTAAMGISLLAGCGGSEAPAGNGDAAENPSTSDSDKNAADGEDADAGNNGEVSHIIMTYLTIGMTPPDIQMVQDAVNEISVPQIGVEVEFKPVAIPDTFSNYSMWIGSGEQIDLMCVAFQGLNNYVNSGQLQPLDDLMASDGSYIAGLAEEFPITDGGQVQGSVYGIAPVMPFYGFHGGMVMREDYMKELGQEQKEQYTLEELTDILMQIKANHPDCYPVCVLGSSVGAAATNFGFYYEMDNR